METMLNELNLNDLRERFIYDVHGTQREVN